APNSADSKNDPLRQLIFRESDRLNGRNRIPGHTPARSTFLRDLAYRLARGSESSARYRHGKVFRDKKYKATRNARTNYPPRHRALIYLRLPLWHRMTLRARGSSAETRS